MIKESIEGSSASEASRPKIIVMNWFEKLKQKVPVP
jgi:hypothetical protein